MIYRRRSARVGVEHTLLRIQHHPANAMNEFPSHPVTPTPLAENVIEAANELKAAAEAKAREFSQAASGKLHEFKDAAGCALEDSSSTLKEMGDHAVAYVKENPGKSVLAGLGAGFLIGLLFRDK